MNYKLSDFARVHFIGIGGIGMSGLARLFLHEGKTVSGSDGAASAITAALAREGVAIFPEQVASNITPELDLIIYTEAMAQHHEEMRAARQLGVPMCNYFEALGMVANEYYLIAVSGTHGKTTTTAMLIDILEAAEFDPTAIVGSLRAKSQSNYRSGKSKYFIAEACEYRRDFLSLRPDVLVITNLEHEHVDYYADLWAVQSAFRELALRVPSAGYIIAETSDTALEPVLAGVEATVVDYTKWLNLLRRLAVPGVHNQLNAAAALAAAAQVGVKSEVAETAVAKFSGTWRRFEYKGEVNGAKVYDDYGHHPTEIRATIAGVRELYPEAKLTLVYEPHTYSRTHTLFADFVSALALADTVYLLPIYTAREGNESGVTSEQLVAALRENGHSATYLPDQATAVSTLKAEAQAGEVIVVTGAGAVTAVASELTK